MTAYGPELPRHAELAPGLSRVVAPNPGMMTGPGTNTYLIGDRQIAVLDPGPAIEEHTETIMREAVGPIRWIIVTHTHPDHSPGAEQLARETGAERIGMPAPEHGHQDRRFVPDRIVRDGSVIRVGETDLEAVHTPGHASNHVCFWHRGLDWLFTGDHVIDGSTVVIDPPDGDMKAYIDSLSRCRELRCRVFAPGHGDLIRSPDEAVDWLIRHRLERETKVLAALAGNPDQTSHELVRHVYRDVSPELLGLAERSLLAHLLKLEAEGRASQAHGRWQLA